MRRILLGGVQAKRIRLLSVIGCITRGATTSNAEKFEELLRSNEELQAKLKAATEAFEGDMTDEAAVFDAVIAPLATEAGVPFTLDEAKEFAVAGADLSDEDLDAVAGGGGMCYIGGGGDSAGACKNEEAGAGACAAIGVSVFVY